MNILDKIIAHKKQEVAQLMKEVALEKINSVMSNGQAAEKFEKMVYALGGPSDILSSHEKHLKINAIKKDIFSIKLLAI